MDGSVIRQKVCHQPEPSVAAASSWSVPSSCSTGSTSRTTNGRVTKTLASTMPGRPKMILNPTSFSTKPSAPADPHNTINATPTMTGETANGRSMIACSTPLPRNLLRASTNAVGIPKITFSGTTIATTSSDKFSADIAGGGADPGVELAEPGLESTPQDHRHRNDQQHEDVSQRNRSDEVANSRETFIRPTPHVWPHAHRRRAG